MVSLPLPSIHILKTLLTTCAASSSIIQNFGLSGSDFNVAYTLWNFSIGKKLFRNNRGEINLFVNDILDQNRSFQRRWSALYLENVTNTSIGRYVGISMTYNLRNYGGKMKGPKDVPNFESLRDGGGRAPMGPPPGGFGGRRPM